MDQNFELDPLTRLSIRHGTDKWGPHYYTPVYHELFARLREAPIRLLEIGVGGYALRSVGGASLAMWADYFPNGRIVGIDVAEKRLPPVPRVTILCGSQTDDRFLRKVAADHGPFDIVIDDGSHLPRDVVTTFHALFPGMAHGGLYVVEDVQTAFWPDYGGAAVTGGATLQLAQSILQALNHRELLVTAPGWQVPEIAPAIRSFRAFHNLFVIEKGDNTEPSNLSCRADDPHLLNAISTMEREMGQFPTAMGHARLASVYDMAGRLPLALATVQQALVRWPHHISLLTAAATFSARSGDTAAQLSYLERAVLLEPEDAALRQKLDLARAQPS